MIESIKIELGGKERILQFDLGVMSDYEDLTGANALMENIFENISAKKLRALIFVVLKVNEPEITIEECGKFVNAGNMADVIEGLSKAFKLGMAEPDKKKEVKEK